MKVLAFDIETSPPLAMVWGTGKQTVTSEQLLSESKIICIAWMWKGEKKVNCLAWDKNQDETKMLQAFSDVIQKADVVVGHNMAGFDIKHLQGRFLKLGLKPRPMVLIDDTLKELRKAVRLPSYKLDYVAQWLGIGHKLRHHGLSTWKRVLVDNDRKELKLMKDYCKQDVIGLTMPVYERIASYVDRASNLSIYNGDVSMCPNCESRCLKKDGFSFSKVGKYQRYRCHDCGKQSRGGKNLVKKSNEYLR